MNVDVEQFHAVFFDESNEHLQAMEDLLMTLDVDNPDSEALNSIFRAAHSIKGGSGIFGFDALTGLTHVMETLLDRARNQTMSLSVEIVDLFLETVDTLNATLQAYKDGGELPSDAINAGIEKLEAVLGRTGSSEQAAQAAQAGESDDVLAESEDADDGFARQIAGALRPAAKNVKVQVIYTCATDTASMTMALAFSTLMILPSLLRPVMQPMTCLVIWPLGRKHQQTTRKQ